MIDDDQLQFLELSHLTCADIRELVDPYLDHTLLAALHVRFDEHLGVCEMCRSLVADLEQLLISARALSDEPVPGDVGRRLREALQEKVGFRSPTLRNKLKN